MSDVVVFYCFAVVIRSRRAHEVLPHYRRDLGRVMVTIDDLQALLNLLTEMTGPGGEVYVDCDEGEFTEAKDMHNISDAALRDLVVSGGGVVVHLSPARAEVVGDVDGAGRVHREWAQPRQTTKKARRWTQLQPSPALRWLALGIIPLWVGGSALSRPATERLGLLFASGVGLAMALLVAWLYATYSARFESYAVVVAKTKQEIRNAKARPSRLAVVAVVVPILALTAFLIFSYLNYFYPHKP